MCDWNNNGEYDMQDAFISYHIHRSISGNKQNQSSSGDNGDVLAVFAMPAVGLYLAFAGEETGQRTLGVVLLIVGIIVYAKFGML